MTMARILAVAVIPAVLFGGVALASDKAAALPLALGASMPMGGEKLKNVDGKEITLDSMKGPKGTLVVFTCNACPWAKAWEDRIVALGNEYQKKGVGVIAINANDPAVQAEDGYDNMKTRAKDKGFGFPYVVDATSGVARAFGATRTPEAFLFDAKGALVYHGTIDDNAQQPDQVKERYLSDALKSVTGGSEVAVKETKAMGCGIKFRS